MTKLLLCEVYKPYGVQDDTSEAMCTMELLNNQVTREQGIHSPRSNNPSFGLYLLAENLHIPVTVLDFPSWAEFTKEIDNGEYSHVGISFIVPNALKAKKMAEYIREKAPRIKILLGGHGTAIPEIEKLVPCDEICHGEGVYWLRNYFGEDTDRPIIHPIIRSAINCYVYGAPVPDKAGILIPGVGCQNSCRFCSTSHKFEHKYTAFLKTGKDIFDVCSRSEEKLGVDDFGVMDENFCKDPERARQLLDEMEAHGKAYSFSIFSSAEAILELGTDFLQRLGVNFVWIGVESKENLFEKTKGIDLHKLITDLQKRGISVLASSILFLEHHDKKTIHEDIEWAIGLESDLSQFMELGPEPGTKLYKEYEESGKLLSGIPWQKKHGQDEIWFSHPKFSSEESFIYLKDAFIKKYLEHGPAVLSMAKSAVSGYLQLKEEIEIREKEGLQWDPKTLRYIKGNDKKKDEFIRLRLESMRINALKFRPALSTMMKYAPNEKAVEKCKMVKDLFQKAFGPMTMIDRLKSVAVGILAILENRKIKKYGNYMRQPATNRVLYPERRFILDKEIKIEKSAVDKIA
jgi:radical SAM superfamily enzyme YgiQ (UPF0313 family)